MPGDQAVFDALMRRRGDRGAYRVLVTGLMHCGKSTFMNTILRILTQDWDPEMLTPCQPGTATLAGRRGPAGAGAATDDALCMTTKTTLLGRDIEGSSVHLVDSPHISPESNGDLLLRIVNGLPFDRHLLGGNRNLK